VDRVGQLGSDRLTDPTMTTLSESGQIRITQAAALRWLAAAGSEGVEAARAELLDLLLDAQPIDREVEPERWRARSLSTGWDISVSVVREGRVAVVVAINARPYQRRRDRR